MFFLLLLSPRIVSLWRVSQPSDSVHELRESTFSTGSVLVDCHFAVTLYAEGLLFRVESRNNKKLHAD